MRGRVGKSSRRVTHEPSGGGGPLTQQEPADFSGSWTCRALGRSAARGAEWSTVACAGYRRWPQTSSASRCLPLALGSVFCSHTALAVTRARGALHAAAAAAGHGTSPRLWWCHRRDAPASPCYGSLSLRYVSVLTLAPPRSGRAGFTPRAWWTPMAAQALSVQGVPMGSAVTVCCARALMWASGFAR